MHYKVKKLDNRHSWRNHFDCMLEFSRSPRGTGVLDFDRARRWFVDTYGWSQDCETRASLRQLLRNQPRVMEANEVNPVWAYSIQYGEYRIYVATEKELTWFLMSHPISAK